jgi:CRISPR-associated protein Csx17
MKPIPLPGCRHDVLGHHLKAIGILRALATCADAEHRDPDAEGWWDLATATFRIRSAKYPTIDDLVGFFAQYYLPTLVISAWDKDIAYSQGILSPEPPEATINLARRLSQEIHSAPQAHVGEVKRRAFSAFRNQSDDIEPTVFDAIASVFTTKNADNPVFLARGAAGRAQLFRTLWDHLDTFTKERKKTSGASNLVQSSLFGERLFAKKGKGAPFFPDAIKIYNHGASWMTETFPFNALDYVLAVEGAYALRGSASRTLAANSRRFAAFPFVFETGECMTDDAGDTRGTARAVWLPLWGRPTSWAELSSFFCDAQARLPGKEARFSSEFARALRAQGVDAGFAGWQEFRFKMKGSKVPWVVTGIYIGPRQEHRPALLADALHPLDESGFLDQFEEKYKGGKLVSQSPHPYRTRINAAVETAIQDPSPASTLAILEAIFAAARQTCVSKSFREMLHGEPRFFAPLPAAPWVELLRGEDSPEFRIARALASIVVFDGQADGRRSEAQPFLGSLLPLKLGQRGWYLPSDSSDLSKQAVWTGTDLCADLARVLGRRYLDSLKDDRPALLSRHPAPLGDVLAFLRNELDERLIARWTEALSLIGWDSRMQTKDAYSRDDFDGSPIPLAYAALRAVVDLECELQSGDRGEWKHRRSQRPVALLCQRSPSSLSLAVEDALRWCGIWGVPNPYGAASRALKPRLAGKEVVHVAACRLAFGDNADLVHRLPASVLVPIDDPQPLFRSVTLPQRES